MTQDCNLCLDPVSHRIFPSRDVSFSELDFSLSQLLSQSSYLENNVDLCQKSITFLILQYALPTIHDSCSESQAMEIDSSVSLRQDVSAQTSGNTVEESDRDNASKDLIDELQESQQTEIHK